MIKDKWLVSESQIEVWGRDYLYNSLSTQNSSPIYA